MTDSKFHTENLTVEYIKVTELSFLFDLPYIINSSAEPICESHLAHVCHYISGFPMALSTPIVSKNANGSYKLIRKNKDLIHIIALYYPLLANINPLDTLIYPVKSKNSKINFPVCSVIAGDDDPFALNFMDILSRHHLSDSELKEFEICVNHFCNLEIPVVVFNSNDVIPFEFCPNIKDHKLHPSTLNLSTH